jgi:hypothetical protein
MDERLTKHICEAMGIPQELTQGGKTTSASTAGIFFIMNEKVKMETAWLQSQIEYAMLLCYGDAWNNGYDEIKRRIAPRSGAEPKFGKFMQATAGIDMSIQLDCVPLLTGEQAKELWRDGFMTKDDVAEILQGQYLIPEELMHVLAMPDRDPAVTLQQQQMQQKAKAQKAGSSKSSAPAAPPKKRPLVSEEEMIK